MSILFYIEVTGVYFLSIYISLESSFFVFFFSGEVILPLVQFEEIEKGNTKARMAGARSEGAVKVRDSVVAEIGRNAAIRKNASARGCDIKEYK